MGQTCSVKTKTGLCNIWWISDCFLPLLLPLASCVDRINALPLTQTRCSVLEEPCQRGKCLQVSMTPPPPTPTPNTPASAGRSTLSLAFCIHKDCRVNTSEENKHAYVNSSTNHTAVLCAALVTGRQNSFHVKMLRFFFVFYVASAELSARAISSANEPSLMSQRAMAPPLRW